MTAAVVRGVKVIRITSAVADLAESYIQVAEVVAIEAGTGIDVALSSEGASARASSSYEGWAVPENAIDGRYPCAFLESFCSATPAADEYLEITLAKPCDLASVSIYGRGDYGHRDLYTVTLLDDAGVALHAGGVDGTQSWGAQSMLPFPPAPATPRAPMTRPPIAEAAKSMSLGARLAAFLGFSSP